MNMLNFEHPLNEKTRIYLRIEDLLSKLEKFNQPDTLTNNLFFKSLFDLLDIFEQIQLKAELIKDLEKQRIMYRAWLSYEGINRELLLSIITQLNNVHKKLHDSERCGQTLKEDRFLSSVKQRFNLPGALDVRLVVTT